ncbi:MAG: SDR family oxidoreductase [Bacillota bacterium]|nr:SDR family oxidoreductase [Bacillota bacterium]
MEISLKGKIAVITGAASGIGLATSKLFSLQGAKVIMLDVSSKGKEIASEITNAQFIYCDVTNVENVKEVADIVKEQFGTVDILFNNAGVTVRKTVVELTEREWDFVIDVGLKGVFLMSKYFIPLMEKNGGSIINTGSGWGLKGGNQAAAYCAVKGGIVNLTRAMAIDHGKDKIRVNSVNPGDTDTAMLRDEGLQTGDINEMNNVNEYLNDCGNDRPLARIGMPSDIAKAVLFLASDLSEWITGTALVVDGGGIA